MFLLRLRFVATRSSSASGGEVEEGGSGLTSETERAYWIGQQLIWNPYPSGESCRLELFIDASSW